MLSRCNQINWDYSIWSKATNEARDQPVCRVLTECKNEWNKEWPRANPSRAKGETITAPNIGLAREMDPCRSAFSMHLNVGYCPRPTLNHRGECHQPSPAASALNSIGSRQDVRFYSHLQGCNCYKCKEEYVTIRWWALMAGQPLTNYPN